MRDDEHPRGPVPVSEILERLWGDLGLTERVQERRLLEAWPQIVGTEAARYSRAIDLANGVLVLQADHGVWRQELTLLIPTIIAKYNEKFGPGTVHEIRWDRRLPRARPRDNGV